MKKKTIIITGVVLLIGLFVILGIFKSKNSNISVKTIKVTKGNVESYLSTTGNVVSKNKKNILVDKQRLRKLMLKLEIK